MYWDGVGAFEVVLTDGDLLVKGVEFAQFSHQARHLRITDHCTRYYAFKGPARHFNLPLEDAYIGI